ncbi:MAG: F0F1 ATP synthase subunit B [Acidimicrobiia bacterium]|nr:MAG: F0F1 ATP synthase subunit B [Acidimicrobiia bacterium]
MNMVFNLILATEAVTTTEESGGIDLLLPAPEELIAGILAFSIIFGVAWKYALPTLTATLQSRQDAVTSKLESAEKTKEEAATLLSDYRSQVAGAKEEAAQIIADAREAGEAVKADIVARANVEAEAIKERSREEVAAERERVAGDLRRQVADLSIEVAEKVVSVSIDAGSQRELIDRYIDELGGVR